MRVLESKVVRHWLVVLLLCMLIALPSLVCLPLMPRGPVFDKVAHCLVYAVAGFFVFRGALALPLGKSRGAAICFAFLVAAVIGTVDEVIQLFVPNRQMDRMDLLFDLVGITGGICFYLVMGWRGGNSPHESFPGRKEVKGKPYI